MLQAVEAEIGEDGEVRLLEPLALQGRHRAVVTVLGPIDGVETGLLPGSGAALLALLDKSRLPSASRLTAEEIDAQIQEERKAWD
ncbi:MAG: hypothetical protein HQL64_04725 [Magnetococcales bacterium]|nr:hypothetical protein [Magnetococcales bacterium]